MKRKDAASKAATPSPETATPLQEIPSLDGYIYCKEHDIFYNEQLKRDAEKRIADFPGDEEEKMLFSFSVHSCPCCIAGMISRVISMGSRTESRHRFTGVGIL